ncbi:MAG: extracellular solute-binding protein [Anaerolineae bacterium]|nr:extracellular solute-binding protein [Anaerolineae bacterium]
MPNRGMIRRSVAGVVLVLMLTLAACAPAPSPTPAPSPLPTLTSTADASTPVPTVSAPNPLVVTLTLWVPDLFSPYGDGLAAEVLAQQMDAFAQAYPDLQVRVVTKKAEGRGGLLDFLRTASVAAPSVLPDLVILSTADLQLATQAGLLQPLDPFLREGLAADRFPFATALGQVGEQTMGVVLGAEMMHLAYRPDLLPDPPITWTDVISAPAPFLFPISGPGGDVTDAFLCQYIASGGDLLDEAGAPTLDVMLLGDQLLFYQRAVAAGVISPTVVAALADTAATWEQFQAEQAALAVVNSHQFWSVRDPDLAPAPFPTRIGHSVTIAEGWVVALVAADPTRQSQAMTFVEWLLAPENLGAWTQSVAYLPSTLSALEEWDVTEAERATLEVLLEGAMPPIDPALRAEVGPPLQAALAAVLEGRRTPAEAARIAVEAVRQ